MFFCVCMYLSVCQLATLLLARLRCDVGLEEGEY